MARSSRPDSVISSYGSRRVLAPSVFLNLAQVVSFTQGSGPEGFIVLSPDRSDIVRARVDAVNLLPYLGGSGLRIPMLALILGIVGQLFVLTPPLGAWYSTERIWGYSWLGLIQSQVRGSGRVLCTRTNQPSAYRSRSLRRLTTSIS